ncbi:type IV secretion system protein TraC [Hydromonas duriensis]|uniref:Conjugal transfer ATP-binding protein TraC n=1 Tax=Hydromonas duriensis TaxID=1527608 RepID=A0A4R6Y6Z1_9BURK|nr:type IV secretion system protein TraC [Hydromonas duriensis]TDR30288.1 conjugal transfer ATP-binding protein TraC [Hydromonas duriensis]
MLKHIKNFIFGGDQDPEAVPEAYEQDPMDPRFMHFSDRLNIGAWDETHQLFHLDCVDGHKHKDVGVGFVVELNPMLGASEEELSIILSLFQLLPDHSGVQVITFGSPNINKFLNAYEAIQSSRGDTPLGRLFTTLGQKRTKFWKDATQKNVFKGFPIRLRHFRVIVSVNLNGIDSNNPSDMEHASTVRQQIISTLSSANLFRSSWRPNDLLAWNRDLLNPGRLLYGEDEHMVDEVDEMTPLRDQMIHRNTFLRFFDSGEGAQFGFKRTNNPVTMRTYSVKTYPSNRPFNINGMRRLIGDEKKTMLNYPCPFYLVMNMVKGDYEKVKSATILKAARATQRSSQPLAAFLPEIAEKARDWGMLQASYNENTGGPVKCFNQLVLLDHPDNIIASENTALAIWRASGFELVQDIYLQKQSLLSAMPMALDEDFIGGLEQTKRFTTKTMLNAVNLSPMMGEWTGIGRPLIGLFGRNGEAMALDLFSNPSGNYNAAVVGASGSGKSFFLNELARNLLGSGAHGYIIDKGRSYKALCQFIGGQYIEFNTESSLVLAPFDMVVDINEDREMLKLIISTMAAPNTGLNEYQGSVVEKIITKLWVEKGNQANMDDMAEALIHYKNDHGQLDPEINRLGTQMFSFTTAGVYGRWFNGQSNLKFDSELVVLEMDDLSNKPDLQKVIIKLVLYLITQKMYETRERRKFCMIDEAWDLLEGGTDAAKFINEGYRKIRKYDGSFITATQNAVDYSLSLAAQAALQNSDWVFALRGKEQTVVELADKLKLGESEQADIRSLQTVQGVFSEIWMYYAEGSGIGRLYSDPYNHLMSSTKASDFEALRLKQKQGMSISEALDAVMQDRAAAGIEH